MIRGNVNSVTAVVSSTLTEITSIIPIFSVRLLVSETFTKLTLTTHKKQVRTTKKFFLDTKEACMVLKLENVFAY
jgi:hypothetical protein